MEMIGEIEIDAVVTNPQVPQDAIVLQLPLAQSSALFFCCLQQSFCTFVMQHDAFS
ncbi:MAG: hypothetical protein JWR09_1158 [Mucilaginibacter sp.]|nr:hypothetical protein [Mucilaginibacter sp.]